MLHQFMLYPLERKVRGMFDRFIKQVRKYRDDCESGRCWTPRLETRILYVRERFLRLLDSGVDRKRRQSPMLREASGYRSG
jgi:hypothetical protein